MRIRLRRTAARSYTLDESTGAPTALHGTVITPEHRLFVLGGRHWGILRARPVAVTVQRPGAVFAERVPVPDPTRRRLGLIMLILFLAWLVPLVIARQSGDGGR